MDKHVTEWLGIFLDGELETGLEEQVRGHLAVCDECQEEFVRLQALSGLLQSGSIPMIDAATFAAHLNNNLPERPGVSLPGRNPQTIWWLIPLVLLVLGFTNRMISHLAGLLLLAGQAGYLGDVIHSLSTSDWLSIGSPSLLSLMGSRVSEALNAILPGMGSFGLVAGGVMEELAWLGGLLFVCAAWLVAGWNKRALLNKKTLSQD